MTKAEAAAILGIPEDVTLHELRRRYESLHTDYQIRLTNAPTPALKKTYQQKLQELVTAGETLHSGFSTNTTGGDLPSADPVLADLSASPAEVARLRPAPVTAGSVRSTLSPPDSKAAMADSGLPRSTIVVGVVAVVLAAALSFALLKWSQAVARVDTLQAEGEKLLTAAKGLQGSVEANERLLYADGLRVHNVSSKAVRISTAAFVYRDTAGVFKVAHSGNYGYPMWDLRPGATAQLDVEIARGRLWDGPVIYYAFLLEYPGVEPFLKAGIWVEDVNRIDKAVALDLD